MLQNVDLKLTKKKGDHVIPAAKFLLKKLSWIQLLNRTHCLPIELRKIGRDKTYEIEIKTPLLTFITYFEDDILRVYQRLEAKNADLRLQHCKSPQTIYYFSGKPTNSFHWNFLQVLFSNSEKIIQNRKKIFGFHFPWRKQNILKH